MRSSEDLLEALDVRPFLPLTEFDIERRLDRAPSGVEDGAEHRCSQACCRATIRLPRWHRCIRESDHSEDDRQQPISDDDNPPRPRICHLAPLVSMLLRPSASNTPTRSTTNAGTATDHIKARMIPGTISRIMPKMIPMPDNRQSDQRQGHAQACREAICEGDFASLAGNDGRSCQRPLDQSRND